MNAEKEIEKQLVSALKSVGCHALKFIPLHLVGMPDRLILIPGGRVAWVELKSPGKTPRPIQVYRIDKLTQMGFKVFVVDGEEGINKVLTYVEEVRC